MTSEEIRIYYIVEKILDTRINHGEREYLILWKGFGREEASWESAKHCDCPGAIAAFHKERRAARFSTSRSWTNNPYSLRRKSKPSRRCSHLPRSTALLKNYDETSNTDAEDEITVTEEKEGEAKTYKVQSGRKIAALLDAHFEGGELVYTVLYQGKEPKEERTDHVPSSILRKYAIEEFTDCLERLALARCDDEIYV